MSDELIQAVLEDAGEQMDKAVAHARHEFAGVRTGRANPGLVDSLRVEVYGSQSPIKQIASVSAPEPQQLVIRPFDPSTIKDIERSIINSDLGLAPNSDGKVIRLNIPPLSGDVRKKRVARTKELAEEAKSLVEHREIDMGHARALLSAENPARVADLVVDQQLSVREAEALVRHLRRAIRRQKARAAQ